MKLLSILLLTGLCYSYDCDALNDYNHQIRCFESKLRKAETGFDSSRAQWDLNFAKVMAKGRNKDEVFANAIYAFMGIMVGGIIIGSIIIRIF